MLTQAKNFHIVIFFASLVIYLALAQWMTAHWKPLGDEPHYLVAAHSLVVDRDFDLANNYAQRDYQKFLKGETLDPHVKILPNGAQWLNHDLGLPILLALPYALGGRAGVEIFLACVAALLAWQMWKLAFDVTHSALWSTVSWLALAFTPPLVVYATLIYPEALGALIFIFCARTFLFQNAAEVSPLRVGVLAMAAVLLPFLSVRFVVLAMLLVVFAFAQWHAQRSRAIFFAAIVALSIGAYFFINNVLLAGTVPRGNPTELVSGNLATFSLVSLARGIVGWWIDPQRGTLIMAPIYLLALAGIPRLFREQPLGENFRVGILLVSPFLILIPLVALLGGFWIPFEVGARYFVVALPLLAAPLALGLRAGFAARAVLKKITFAALLILLLSLSVWNGALMISDASYAYGSVVSAYSRVAGNDLSPFFASMGRRLLIVPTIVQENSIALIEEREGEIFWRAPAGRAGTIIQSFDLAELTVGHYVLNFRAGTIGTTTNAELLLLDVYSAEGLPIVHASWRANELKNNSLERVAVEFDNPYFDRWGFPLTLQVMTTGETELVLSAIEFTPDNATTWLRAGIWLALIALMVVVLNLDLLNPKSFRPIVDGPRRE